MKFVVLDENRFNEYASSHELSSFQQCSYWGKLKADNGWAYEFVGVEDDLGNLCAAALLVSKKLAKLFKFYYSPRGLLVDYNNEALVSYFSKEIKKYILKHGGMVLKIDPYVDEKELDMDGNVVEGGYDNSHVRELLQKNGFTFLVNKDGTPQATGARCIFALDFNGLTNDELFSNFAKHVKQSIKSAIKYGVKVEELSYDELSRFKTILENTSKRRRFIDRPLSYYQMLYKAYGDSMKFCVAVLDMDIYKEKLMERYEKAQKTYDRLFARKQENPESTRYDGELKEAKVNLDSSKKGLDEADSIISKYGKVIDLSCACYFLWGNEVLNQYGGNEEELLKYGGQYYLHWHMIQYANNHGYTRYNFYGIPYNLNKENNPLYGVYEIKRGFRGRVMRLIGEYDMVLRPVLYGLYYFMFETYKKIKYIQISKK